MAATLASSATHRAAHFDRADWTPLKLVTSFVTIPVLETAHFDRADWTPLKPTFGHDTVSLVSSGALRQGGLDAIETRAHRRTPSPRSRPRSGEHFDRGLDAIETSSTREAVMRMVTDLLRMGD